MYFANEEVSWHANKEQLNPCTQLAQLGQQFGCNYTTAVNGGGASLCGGPHQHTGLHPRPKLARDQPTQCGHPHPPHERLFQREEVSGTEAAREVRFGWRGRLALASGHARADICEASEECWRQPVQREQRTAKLVNSTCITRGRGVARDIVLRIPCIIRVYYTALHVPPIT